MARTRVHLFMLAGACVLGYLWTGVRNENLHVSQHLQGLRASDDQQTTINEVSQFQDAVAHIPALRSRSVPDGGAIKVSQKLLDSAPVTRRGVELLVDRASRGLRLSEAERARLTNHFALQLSLVSFRGSLAEYERLRSLVEPLESILGEEAASEYRRRRDEENEQVSRESIVREILRTCIPPGFTAEQMARAQSLLHLSEDQRLAAQEIRSLFSTEFIEGLSEVQIVELERALSRGMAAENASFTEIRIASDQERDREVLYLSHRLQLSAEQTAKVRDLNDAALLRFEELTSGENRYSSKDAMQVVREEYRRSLHGFLNASQRSRYDTIIRHSAFEHFQLAD